MNAENSTGNPARLPLAERARQGLLLAEPELLAEELPFLEHPTDKAARLRFANALRVALNYGDLVLITRQVERLCYVPEEPVTRVQVTRRVRVGDAPIWNSPALPMAIPRTKAVTYTETLRYFNREAYRAWRLTCPPELLSSLTQIFKWLGATPTTESILPAETSLPAVPSLPEPEPVAVGGAALPATREIALFDAENAALLILRRELKREPDFEEFWNYLTTRDDTGTVADSTEIRLDWVGKGGKSCNTSRRSIRNRLTNAKKRNPFTPS